MNIMFPNALAMIFHIYRIFSCDGTTVNMGFVYDKVASFDGRQAKNFLLIMTSEEEGLSGIYSTTAITACSGSCLQMVSTHMASRDFSQAFCDIFFCWTSFCVDLRDSFPLLSRGCLLATIFLTAWLQCQWSNQSASNHNKTQSNANCLQNTWECVAYQA